MLLEPEKKGIVHVTGFNLAAVVETLVRSEPLTPELMDEIVGSASAVMRRMACVSDASADVDATSDDDGFSADGVVVASRCCRLWWWQKGVSHDRTGSRR